MGEPSSIGKVYRPVVIIAVITLLGLLLALCGDGIWDGMAWIALVIPLGTVCWKYGQGNVHGWMVLQKTFVLQQELW